jgi:hypothetical protein
MACLLQRLDAVGCRQQVTPCPKSQVARRTCEDHEERSRVDGEFSEMKIISHQDGREIPFTLDERKA